MKLLKYCHDLFLKCILKIDLFLVDIFEKFRNNILKDFELCQSHYLSTPALSRNAMLTAAQAELQLISYRDIYLLFSKRYERLSFLHF